MLLQKPRRQREDQRKMIFPLVSLVLLPHLRYVTVKQHRQHPPKQFFLPLTCPIAVVMGTQESVPFA
jgi:hypothetical protein